MCGWINLLGKKNFLPLFLTQFFGAFNDNAFKLAMLTLISYHVSTTQEQSEHLQAIAGGLFILPFFIFSATAGQLADKFNRTTLIRIIKLLEILLMIFGSYSLFHKNVIAMLAVLTGLGIHSTFFGPIKYAILPDHLPKSSLLLATSLIEGSTFIAILLGTTFGTIIVDYHISYTILLINLVAILGALSSLFIPPAPSKDSELTVDWRFWQATRLMIKETVANRVLLLPIIVISWFWLVGTVMLTKLPDYVHFILNADTTVFAVFLVLFSVGIACGSVSVALLLKDQITLRYVPLAMFLLSLFGLDIYWASLNLIPDKSVPLQNVSAFFHHPNHWRITFDFFFFCFCGGLFAVPLYTFLQVKSNEEKRARTLAANNIFNAFAMVLGSALLMLLLFFKVELVTVFLLLAIGNLLAAFVVWICLRKK